MPEEGKNTWRRSFKDQIVWFVFAVLLAFGGSYINSQNTTVKVKADIRSLDRRVMELKETSSSNNKQIQTLREDMARIEEKINAMMEHQNIKYTIDN